MSNQAIIDVRHFDDDVIVLAEDNYGKTFLSFEPEVFASHTVESLLETIAGEQPMEGSFYIHPDNYNVVCDLCDSVEVHGFYPPSNDRHGEVFVFTDQS